jgi:hypothetical protein
MCNFSMYSKTIYCLVFRRSSFSGYSCAVRVRRKLQLESRVPDENRDPGYKMTPTVGPGDDVWIPGRPRLMAGIARNDDPAFQPTFNPVFDTGRE